MGCSLSEKIRTYIECNEEEERFIGSIYKRRSLAKGEHFLLAVIYAARQLLSKGVFFAFT